jgi:hypothetical protein
MRAFGKLKGLPALMGEHPWITGGLAAGGVGSFMLKDKIKKKKKKVDFMLKAKRDWDHANRQMELAPPGTQKSNPLYWLGGAAREYAAKPALKFLSGNLESSPYNAALAGALPGLVAGGLFGGIRERSLDGMLRYALMGGAAGGAAGAGLSTWRHANKNPGKMTWNPSTWGFNRKPVNPLSAYDNMIKNSYTTRPLNSGFGTGSNMAPPGHQLWAPTADNKVLGGIYSDSALTYGQKEFLRGEVMGLASSDPRAFKQLEMILRGAMGAGVGLLIAKFLLKLGKKSTLLTMIIGGAAGALSHRNRGGPLRNPFGKIHTY